MFFQHCFCVCKMFIIKKSVKKRKKEKENNKIYYTASMSAQTVTPVLLGLLFTRTGAWKVLPVYASILLMLSFVVFTIFVKNIKAVKVKNAKGLDAIGGDD